MSKELKNFMDFVRTHGVVGLAVGLAIGTQVGKAVETIVVNLINPIVGFIVGDTKGLEQLDFTITAGSRSMTIGWGAILSALITLLAVSAVIYWVVQGLKLDKTDKKSE
jgi:large conductance mechanosensitive channel